VTSKLTIKTLAGTSRGTYTATVTGSSKIVEEKADVAIKVTDLAAANGTPLRPPGDMASR
jgi:hypothetical protein